MKVNRQSHASQPHKHVPGAKASGDGHEAGAPDGALTLYGFAALDGSIFRAGQLFGSLDQPGAQYDWPMPSTVAGFVRAAIVEASGQTRALYEPTESPTSPAFSHDRVRAIGVRSVGMLVNGIDADEIREPTNSNVDLLLPAPGDAVFVGPSREQARLHRLVPRNAGDTARCNLAHELRPLELSGVGEGAAPEKPLAAPTFWNWNSLMQWLEDGQLRSHSLPQMPPAAGQFALAGARDVRTHTRIDPETRVASDESLRQTNVGTTRAPTENGSQSVGYRQSFAAMIDPIADGITVPSQLAGTTSRLGTGQKVATVWRTTMKLAPPLSLERPLFNLLKRDQIIRMILITPGLFRHNGWCPDWLSAASDSEPLKGHIPLSGIAVQLVAAAVGKSTWHAGRRMAGNAMLPSMRVVPAGSVYWLKVTDKPKSLRPSWLQSMATDPQDRADGWAIALFGLQP